MSPADSPRRPGPDPRALLPASGIPLLYLTFAHACLALACAVFIVWPDLPGEYFFHPRMTAVVHLVTLGWISGSILGAFYIVGPLALGLPLRPGWLDRMGFASFAAGTLAMVFSFWTGEYLGLSWSAVLVAASIGHVAQRAWRGLRHARAPWPVKLHVALAFINMLLASGLGMVIALNRVGGWLPWSPQSAAFAHAHLAAVGWAMMMVVGLSYRLIPMIVPAAMPAGSSMATSAVLLQTGVAVLAVALISGSTWTALGALLIVTGLASFVAHVRRIVAKRLPPPAALPRPDWATWQTHVAFVWLLVAAVIGVWLAMPGHRRWLVELEWLYGTLGLVGFLAQIIVGIQGRLLPMHGWYRAFEAGGMQPPARSVHTLADPRLTRWIFLTWTLGVPSLAIGLVATYPRVIATGSVLLLGGVILNALQMYHVATGANRLQP
jgi:hypothetical protein